MKYLLPLFALFFTACQAKEGMQLQVSSEPGTSDWAYISVMGGETLLDSLKLVDGKADFQLTELSSGELYSLTIPAQRQEAYFVFEQGAVTLDLVNGTAQGSPLNEVISGIEQSLSTIMQSTGSYDAMAAMLQDSLQSHLDDPVGALVVYYLDMLTEPATVKTAYNQLGDRAKATSLIKRMEEAWQRLGTTAPGQPFTDFSVEYEGKTTKLSDFVGGGRKLTLVDFWASWCGPCKREIPNLIAVYNKYHDQGVEVVGVATWDKPEATKQAIAEMGIPYPQILNAQNVGSDAYGIQGIPEIMLIGADGTILARGLREEAIEQAVIEHLK